MFRLSAYKKWWPKNEASIYIGRKVDRQTPPSFIRSRLQVSELKTGGGTLFTLSNNTSSNNKHIFYIPGGGYVRGPLMQHWRYLQKLIEQTGATASLLVYPKTPEHNYKEVYDCVWQSYNEVLKNNAGSEIFLMGDSAGGALVLGLAQMLRDKQMLQSKRMILLFPWMDASLKDPDIKKFEEVEPMLDREALQKIGTWYAAGEDMKNPLLSPLYADLTDLAPVTIIAGMYDILWTDIWKFWDNAVNKKFPVEMINFDKMIHGFTHAPIPEAEQAMNIVVKKIMDN